MESPRRENDGRGHLAPRAPRPGAAASATRGGATAGFQPVAAQPAADAVQADSDASPWLLCFHYDPATGRHTFAAMAAVRSAALLAFGSLIGWMAWRRITAKRSQGPRT